MRRRCLVCGGRAVHEHHVVYRQELRRRGGDPRDRRNLVPVCGRCHGDHHSAVRRIPLELLPGCVWVFAEELMGAYGRDYLARYYGP